MSQSIFSKHIINIHNIYHECFTKIKMIKNLKYYNVLQMYLRNGFMTSLMPDKSTLNTRISQKRIN